MPATAPQAALAKWGERMNWRSTTLLLPFVAGEEEEEGRGRGRGRRAKEDGCSVCEEVANGGSAVSV